MWCVLFDELDQASRQITGMLRVKQIGAMRAPRIDLQGFWIRRDFEHPLGAGGKSEK